MNKCKDVNNIVELPKDEVAYGYISKQFPTTNVFFDSYETALNSAIHDQPKHRPFYMIKATRHFEFCGIVENAQESEDIEVPQSLNTDEEIAKSFIEDVEAVKGQLPEPQSMTKEDAIEYIKIWCPYDKQNEIIEALSVEPQEWIPIKTRPLTKEEKEHYAEMGYSDDSVTFMYDCSLPDDGEEVLVTDWLGNVEFDTFIRDECDGCYFEENCDDGEVVAWKHKPSPYKGE